MFFNAAAAGRLCPFDRVDGFDVVSVSGRRPGRWATVLVSFMSGELLCLERFAAAEAYVFSQLAANPDVVLTFGEVFDAGPSGCSAVINVDADGVASSYRCTFRFFT